MTAGCLHGRGMYGRVIAESEWDGRDGRLVGWHTVLLFLFNNIINSLCNGNIVVKFTITTTCLIDSQHIAEEVLVR